MQCTALIAAKMFKTRPHRLMRMRWSHYIGIIIEVIAWRQSEEKREWSGKCVQPDCCPVLTIWYGLREMSSPSMPNTCWQYSMSCMASTSFLRSSPALTMKDFTVQPDMTCRNMIWCDMIWRYEISDRCWVISRVKLYYTMLHGTIWQIIHGHDIHSHHMAWHHIKW